MYNPHNADTTVEKTVLILQSTIVHYEKRLEELEVQSSQAHKDALKACQRKNKERNVQEE